MIKEITSVQNPLIKEVLQLQEKSRSRKKLALCVVEGKREIALAKQANHKIKTLLYYNEIFDNSLLDEFNLNENQLVIVSKEVYRKIAFRDSTEGVIAILETKKLHLDRINFKRLQMLQMQMLF